MYGIEMRSCILLVLFIFLQTTDGLIISTYNLWNTMFNWNIRKLRIREMIQQTNVDIVVFQEVRSGTDPAKQNQLLELQYVLPSQYKWYIYKTANNVSSIDKLIDNKYPSEGIGLISKLPIVDSSVKYLLPHPRDPDKNKRVVLHAVIKDVAGTKFNVIVVHLSYHRQQQCRNIAEIIHFINKKRLKNVILLGDFNTYTDYEWPVKIMIDSQMNRDNKCFNEVNNLDMSVTEKFRGVWASTGQSESGYTFSNMPTPGLQSRPDRILVSSNIKTKSVKLLGNGTRYKQRYKASIHWERFTTIIQSSHSSYQGLAGYPCQHDCGPHGSCQCGVCGAGGNNHQCLLPHCDVCNEKVFRYLVIHSIISVIVVFHMFYSVILILMVAANSYGETMYAFLGCNCCLMNPKLLLQTVRINHRRNRLLRICQMWPIFRLPPYVQLFISVVCLIVIYNSARIVFASLLDLTYNVLDEEFFPSDHLMVIADVVL